MSLAKAGSRLPPHVRSIPAIERDTPGSGAGIGAGIDRGVGAGSAGMPAKPPSTAAGVY